MRRFLSYWKINPRITPEILLYSAYGVWADGVIAEYKPDIILSEAALIHGFMVGSCARDRHIPLVFDTYAEVRDLGMGVNKHLKPKARRRYWETLLGLSELVLGMANCSDGPRMYLPKEKVKVFYDTCDFTRSRESAKESMQECRSALKIPQDAFVVGAVGAFTMRKGHDHLIRASAELSRSGVNVVVVLCGAGDPTEWKEIAKKEGIGDKVIFFQGLSETDLVRLYRSCDIYTNLSNSPRSCGLDLALLEAMATERPIVVYDTGALATAVPEGKNGYVVKADDTVGVVQALETFYALSVVERQNMGRASAEVASKCDIRETARIKAGWLEEVRNNYL
jgi:glycosyltransferase involved in cell wall biosynthesis